MEGGDEVEGWRGRIEEEEGTSERGVKDKEGRRRGIS